MKRVVITGMGTINPLGHTVEESWQNCRNGISGVDYITLFDKSLIPTDIAAEVKDFDAKEVLGNRIFRRSDRTQHFAIMALQQALADSGLEITEELSYDIVAQHVVSKNNSGLPTSQTQCGYKGWKKCT